MSLWDLQRNPGSDRGMVVVVVLLIQDEPSPLVLVQDIDWVQTEKHVFEQASSNPFLVGLHSCFQTQSR